MSRVLPAHPVLRFWLVAAAIEVLFGLALLVVGDADLQRGLEATGLQFNTDLVTAVRLVAGYPAAFVGLRSRSVPLLRLTSRCWR